MHKGGELHGCHLLQGSLEPRYVQQWRWGLGRLVICCNRCFFPSFCWIHFYCHSTERHSLSSRWWRIRKAEKPHPQNIEFIFPSKKGIKHSTCVSVQVSWVQLLKPLGLADSVSWKCWVFMGVSEGAGGSLPAQALAKNFISKKGVLSQWP